LTYMAIIKSRQQHNDDRVRWQIEADHPRSHHRAVDARALWSEPRRFNGRCRKSA
jgi:hypothetical protein